MTRHWIHLITTAVFVSTPALAFESPPQKTAATCERTDSFLDHLKASANSFAARRGQIKNLSELDSYIACQLCNGRTHATSADCGRLRRFREEALPLIKAAARSFFQNKTPTVGEFTPEGENAAVGIACLLLRESKFDPRAGIENQPHYSDANASKILSDAIGAGQITASTLEVIRSIVKLPDQIAIRDLFHSPAGSDLSPTEQEEREDRKKSFLALIEKSRDYAETNTTDPNTKKIQKFAEVAARMVDPTKPQPYKKEVDAMLDTLRGFESAASNLGLWKDPEYKKTWRDFDVVRRKIIGLKTEQQALSSNWSHYFRSVPEMKEPAPEKLDRTNLAQAVGMSALYLKKVWNDLDFEEEFLLKPIGFVHAAGAYNLGPGRFRVLCPNYKSAFCGNPENLSRAANISAAKLRETRGHMEGILNCVLKGSMAGAFQPEYDAEGRYSGSESPVCQ